MTCMIGIRTGNQLMTSTYFCLHLPMRQLASIMWSVGVRGDWHKAVEIFEEARILNNPHPLKGLFSVGCAYANSGQTEKALDCIRKIEQLQQLEPDKVLDADLAMIWLSLGNADKAFHHLFQCVEKKMGPVAIIINHPMFKVPTEDPRYLLMKKKLNLA